MKRISSLNIKIIIFISMIITILICILPMGLCPIWNGEIPEHRNQYEIMADSLLKGHIYMDYGEVDQKLIDMENPYDPDERDKLGVSYYWDHAFYKGKFYMYFGIAPVILNFIPYKIITGKSLTTYRSTQFFATMFIIGMFSLFYFICKKFYKSTRISTYILLSVSLSIISIWVSILQPALYCTAIVSGLCMAIWSIYFFLKAEYDDCSENKSLLYIGMGSLFGALTFACRPPIGFVNFLAVPLCIKYFKKYKFDWKKILKYVLAVLPYVVIGVMLMIYNYLRFESPFEFGQTYQLTMEDQSQYNNLLERIDYAKLIDGLQLNFFDSGSSVNQFPFVGMKGIYFNFPILFLPILFIFNTRFRKEIKNKNLNGFYLVLMVLPIIVTTIDLIFSPGISERYMLDVYYLLAIATFITVATWNSILDTNERKKLAVFINVFAIIMIVKCALLFCVPYDYNYAQYYPERIPNFIEKISFGIL